MRVTLVSVMAAAALMVGCSKVELPTGELKTDSVKVDDAGVESAAIELKIGVGDLTVASGATGLVSGTLEYNVPAWQPIVTQSKDGSAVHLRIEQPSTHGSTKGDTTNRWNLQVSDKVPVTFNVECGVGNAKLNLGDMKLRDISVKVGVGQIDVDLRGHTDHDYNVKLEGGVGEATVYLPADADVHAEAGGGLAPVKVEGLVQHGDYWENSGYGHGKATIHLSAHGGVGQIRIVRTEGN